MHRTQLSLEDWQYEALKSLSERRGESLSEVVRGILSNHLRGRQRRAAAKLAAIEGIGDDPIASGRDHDRYLYDKKQRSQ